MELKLKIIEEFGNLIHRAELGYIDNCDSIIYKILFVELGLDDNRIYEYLLNN